MQIDIEFRADLHKCVSLQSQFDNPAMKRRLALDKLFQSLKRDGSIDRLRLASNRLVARLAQW